MAIQRGDDSGKSAVLDISENGRQIGEKLFAVRDSAQKNDLAQHVIEKDRHAALIILLSSSPITIHESILNWHYRVAKLHNMQLFLEILCSPLDKAMAFMLKYLR